MSILSFKTLLIEILLLKSNHWILEIELIQNSYNTQCTKIKLHINSELILFLSQNKLNYLHKNINDDNSF